MSTLAIRDTTTMLRRNLRHMQRFPLMSIGTLGMPVLMLLLFVHVFGGSLGATLAGGASYVDYLAPGILVMTVGAGAAWTAVNLCTDMGEGIVARFRTMAISRYSVLTGQALSSVLNTVVSLALVIGVALLAGFRPTAGLTGWLAAAGLLVLLALAFTWLGIAFGLAAKTPAGANSSSLPLQFLPFVSSAFVPTDSMSSGLAWVAENQPFTPIIDTLRGLLIGTPIGDSGYWAVGWCLVITAVGHAWSRALFNRDPSR
ncbi:ABC-2 type transport system permease protein [Saccharothrix carnea]|uniref:Transport permease protein n=1 Tax=Saccharothrix carnea TaxID=1280637 RepID=A0A2P8I6N2_SACCR|nr:ABC transporter permease [Saccharothrix carnea]PSL54113.1 ABC-2 type transport system permease protein [Saccharothrix carnea]